MAESKAIRCRACAGMGKVRVPVIPPVKAMAHWAGDDVPVDGYGPYSSKVADCRDCGGSGVEALRKGEEKNA